MSTCRRQQGGSYNRSYAIAEGGAWHFGHDLTPLLIMGSDPKPNLFLESFVGLGKWYRGYFILFTATTRRALGSWPPLVC
jgi:hypothetical protein